jgi:hypothetical protein
MEGLSGSEDGRKSQGERRRGPAVSKCSSDRPHPRQHPHAGGEKIQPSAAYDDGCDVDFLEAGAPVPEPEIH